MVARARPHLFERLRTERNRCHSVAMYQYWRRTESAASDAELRSFEVDVASVRRPGFGSSRQERRPKGLGYVRSCRRVCVAASMVWGREDYTPWRIQHDLRSCVP